MSNTVKKDSAAKMGMAERRARIQAKALSALTPDTVIVPPGSIADAEVMEVQRLIDLTAEKGMSLANVCKQQKFVYARAFTIINNIPELVKRWNNARAYYMQRKVEEMEEIARSEPDVQRARLMCDNIKWEAQRVCRHIYGDNIVITGDADAPLVVKLVAGASELVKRIRSSTDE
jgi:hypothetical protein